MSRLTWTAGVLGLWALGALSVVCAQDEIRTLQVTGSYSGTFEGKAAAYLKACGYSGLWIPWGNVKLARRMPKALDVVRRHGLELFLQHQLWDDPTYVDQDGKRFKKGAHRGCPNNDAWRSSCIEIMKQTGTRYPQKGILSWNSHYWYAVNDEWYYPGHIQRRRYACYCAGCRKRWPSYLQRQVYHDTAPGVDTNGDGRTLNGDTSRRFATWQDVPLPKTDERDGQKHLWHLFHKFRADSYVQYLKELRDATRPYNLYLAPMFNASGAHPDDAVKTGLDDAAWIDVVDMILIEQHGGDHPVLRFSNTRWSTLNQSYKKPVMKILHDMFHSRAETRDPYWRRPTMAGLVRMRQVTGAYTSRLYARCLALDHLRFLVDYFTGWPVLPKRGTCALNWLPYPNRLRELVWWIHFYKLHSEFLSRSTCMHNAKAAVFFPWAGGLWGKTNLNDLKFDCEWGAYGLFANHLDVAIVGETDLLKHGPMATRLDGYKIVHFFATRSIPIELVEKIKAFHKGGGWLFADGDSLTEVLPTTLQKEDLLGRLFHVKVAQATESGGRITFLTDDILPKGTTLEVCGKVWTADLPAPSNARVLATYRGKPVVVQGDRAVWYGFLPGATLFGYCPQRYADTEPVDLYKTHSRRTESLMGLRDLLAVLAYPARQARADGMVEVYREGVRAHNVEVIHRHRADTRLTLIALINHETVPDGFYRVRAGYTGDDHVVWDLTLDQQIETRADGEFPVVIDDNAVTLVVTGPRPEVARFVVRHRRLKDLKDLPWYDMCKWFEIFQPYCLLCHTCYESLGRGLGLVSSAA